MKNVLITMLLVALVSTTATAATRAVAAPPRAVRVTITPTPPTPPPPPAGSSTSVPARKTPSEYPWKTLPPFEISSIDGYQETYDPKERVSFYIEGKAEFDTNPATGFGVAATVHDAPWTLTCPNCELKTVFDESRRAWQISFLTPKDNTKSYEVMIHLYCDNDDSQCANTYGKAAQVEKVLPLRIR